MINIDMAQLAEDTRGLTRESLTNEAMDRATYFWRRIDGSFAIPDCDPQTRQVLEMLIAAATR
jgi:hypothetical protein